MKKTLLALTLCTMGAFYANAALEQKDFGALTPLVTAASDAKVSKAEGFAPTGDYSLELRLKAAKTATPSIRLYGQTGERQGYTFEVADSALTFNDATSLPFPATVVKRLNSGKWVSLRLAFAGDSVFVYHNGIYLGGRTLRLAPLPQELATGTSHKANILRNGAFESDADITYNTIKEESGATCLHTLDGWYIYPNDNVWNSRAFIDPSGADGGNCLRIQQYSWSGGSHRVDALAQQTVNVVPGETYKLSFKAYGGNFEEQFFGYAKLEEIGTGKSKTIDINNTDAFADYEMEYTPTAECKQLKVVFGLKYPGSLLDWGEVPKCPMYVDAVVLQGISHDFGAPVFGYTCADDATVDYVKYDDSGAYAPILAQITTDVSRVMLDASEGKATAQIAVTAQGLASDKMITVTPSPYVTVSPPRLPYNANGFKLKVSYEGTREHVIDTMYIKCGRTVCPVALELFGSKVPEGALSKKLDAENGKYSIDMQQAGPFTMEVRAKTKAGAPDGIKIYAADQEGKGFGVYVADSALTIDNPKSLHSNPLVASSRKNSDIEHTYRVARTADNMIHLWRDGNAAAVLDGSDFIIPGEYAGGSVAADGENLLVNGDFDGAWDVNYVEDGGKKPYMSSLQGWDIYPIEPWNSRQTITKWEVSENDGLDTTNNALKIWRYGWNKGFSDAMVSQAVNVVAGKPYTLSFLAAGGIHESTKYGYVRIEEVENTARAVTATISSAEPKEYKINYTPTAECRQIRIVVGLKSPGAIGSWGSVPEVPITVDKMTLVGDKAIGNGVVGVEIVDGTEVEYVTYNVGEALAPAVPAIGVDVDQVTIKGTGSGANIRITGTNLNPGEDIRIITPAGVTATPNHVAYNAKGAMARIKLTSTANRTYGDIIFRSGTTKIAVPFIGRGTPLEEKDLSVSPKYDGSEAAVEASAFNPTSKGYTVEFRAKASGSTAETSFIAADDSHAIHPFAGYDKYGIYNGTDKSNRVTAAIDKDFHTYRYAVTADRRIFVYRDGAPVDTMMVMDYANPADLATTAADVPEVPVNMLTNPGFEASAHTYTMADDTDGDVFYNYVEGWTILDANNGWNSRTYIEKKVVSDDMGDDNHVLGLNRYQWEDGWTDSKVSQVIDVVPGQTYKLSAMAMGGFRSDDKALGFIRIEEVQTPALGKEIALEQSRYSFEKYELSYKAGSKCRQLRVILGLKKAGKGNTHERLYFDDVCFTGQGVEITPALKFSATDAEVEYYTYDDSGAFAPIMPHINVDDEPLAFYSTLDERTLPVSSSAVKDVEKITLTTTGNFMVEPEEIPANSAAVDAKITFLGTSDGTGSLIVSAGNFRTTVPLTGTASPLECRAIAKNPIYSGAEATYLAGADEGFTPGKQGYTIELAAGLDRYSGGSFEIGSLNSREKGVNLVISDEFTGTAPEVGNVDFLQDMMIPNVGDFVYRITVTPDNLAYIFKNDVALDTLDLSAAPADLKFVDTENAVQADNIVRNGTFSGNYKYTKYEEAYMLSDLAGWHLSGLSEWNCRAYMVADSQNPGNNILNFQRYEWNAGWADGEASQVVNVCPGTRYTFSAETRGGSEDGLNLASMQVQELGSVGTSQSINISNSSSDFTKRTISFVTSDKCRQVKLSFRLSSSGKDHGPKCSLYIRNVTLSGMKPATKPGIYLNSGAPFKFKYFTYDLTGAYLPEGYVGTNDIEATSAIECRGIDGGIRLTGLTAGDAIKVYDLAGIAVESSLAADTTAQIALPAGFYIVAVAGETFKVIVK